jgi:hypothetical protein
MKPFSKIALVLFLFVSFPCAIIHAQSVEWLHSASGPSRTTAAAIDRDGNTVAIGRLKGKSVFGANTLQDSGSFIVKYRDDGTLAWAKELKNISARGIFVTDSSDIYITGYFSDSVRLDTFSITSSGGNDLFVAHYDSMGRIKLLQSYGGPGDEEGTAIALSSRNNLVIAGTFDSTVMFGNRTLKSAGGKDIFILTLDTSRKRKVSMVLDAGGEGDDIVRALSLDVYSNIGICGSFTKNFFLGNNTLQSNGDKDMFLLVIDQDMNQLVLKSIGGAGPDEAMSLTLDPVDNIMLTGYFSNTTKFDSASMSSTGGTDAFITKLDNTGKVIWVQRFGSTGNDRGNALALDAGSNVHIVGAFENTINFDNSHFLYSKGGTDVFAVHYDILGRFTGAKSFGSTLNDEGVSVMTDAGDNVIVAASVAGSAKFDSFSIGGDTSGSFVIARINKQLVGLSEEQQSNSITVFPNPVRGQLNIKIPENQIVSFNLMDISGRSYVCTPSFVQASGLYHIDMTLLPAGIYLLKVCGANYIADYKLIKL